MTKKLHLFLLCTFALLFGSASAQKVVTFEAKSGNTDASTFTKEGVTLSLDQNTSSTAGGGYLNEQYDQMRIYKGAILNISSTEGNIEKVVFTCTANGTSNYGPGNFTVSEGTYTYDGKVGTWVGSQAAVAFNASGAQVRATKIEVTLAPAGENYVAAPTIKGKAKFLETAEVTIAAGEGAAIYYTLDGTEPTAASTLYEGAITLTETATVKAVAVEGDVLSEVVEATFTKVVPEELAFADLCNLTADKKEVKVNFNGVVVAFVDGGTVHLREGENAAALYNIGLDLQQGQVLEGYIVADFKLYNSMPELVVNDDLTDVSTISLNAKPAEVTPYVVSVADLNEGRWMAHYVQLCDVTIETETVDSKTTTYIVQGEDKIACYKGIDLTAFVGTGKTYDIEVLFNSIYKGTPQVKPLFIEEVVVPANTLTYASVSPENNSTVTSLSKLSLTFEEDVVTPNATAFFKVYNEENARVAIASFSFDSNDPKVVNLVLDTELTAAGTYTVTFAEQSFWNNKYDANAEDKGVSAGATYNPEFTLTYTIEGEEDKPVDYTPLHSGTKTNTGRNISAVKLTSTLGENVYELSATEQSQDYTDATAVATFKVIAGEEVTPSVQYGGTWMHHAVFVDFDADGFTGALAEGSEWEPAGDLVAYSFYNNGSTSDEFGWNSVGQSISGEGRANPTIPAFTAPAEPGTYRMRFVQDWCSIDPAGDNDGKFSDFKANGGQIVDVILEVGENTGIETVATKTSNKVYTIDGRMVNAKAGDKLAKGLYIVGGKKIYVK